MRSQARLIDYAAARPRVPRSCGRDELLAAREDERRILARDLHDGLGQSLVVLLMNLRAVQAAPAGDAAPELLATSIDLLNALHSDIRARSRAMHSSVLDDLGLVPALRSHIAGLSKATRTDIGFTAHGASPPARWPSGVETCAFRVAQEAVTNALRHTDGAAIRVAVWINDEQLTLRVEDEGAGFDATAARPASGSASLGLVGMAERAKVAGGLLSISSALGQGTTVSLQFRRRRNRLRAASA
jgi:two-component system sensor histidine kinase UhpB